MKFEINELGAKLLALQSQVSRIQCPSGRVYAATLSDLCRFLANASLFEAAPAKSETLRTAFSREEMPEKHWRRIERVFGLSHCPGSPDWQGMKAQDFRDALAALPPPDPPAPQHRAPATELVSLRASPKTELGRDWFRLDMGPPNQDPGMGLYLHVETMPVLSSCQRYRLGFSSFRIDVAFSDDAMALAHGFERQTVERDDEEPGYGSWTIQFNHQKHEPGWTIASKVRGHPLLGILRAEEALGNVIAASAGEAITVTASIQHVATDVAYIGPPDDAPSDAALEFIAQVMKIAITEDARPFSKLVLAEQRLDVRAIDTAKEIER